MDSGPGSGYIPVGTTIARRTRLVAAFEAITEAEGTQKTKKWGGAGMVVKGMPGRWVVDSAEGGGREAG